MEYVLKNKKTGKYIGIDRASGGYPYDTNILESTKIWNTKEGARNYAETFPNKEMTLHEITINNKPIEYNTLNKTK